jgi:hypothetical protein
MRGDLGCSDTDLPNDGAGMTRGADAILDRLAGMAGQRPPPADSDLSAASLWLAGWLVPLA